MDGTWDNYDEGDNFNPDDWNIDPDEIAKLYAMADMKAERMEWARQQAQKFYNDFESLDVNEAVLQINCLLAEKTLTKKQVNTMLDNMIKIFVETEEYEKCHVCNQIKVKLNK